MQTKLIPLSKLEKSAHNVRRTISKSAHEDLKGSIIAHGLMQNLIVAEAGAKYDVIAGGRRLDALKELQKEGKIPKDYEARCEVVPQANSAEMSLAENVVRQAMHPADEFAAFYALASGVNALAPAAIAERFGTTQKHVMQRLAIAKVHPDIIKAYRAGEITLDAVMAYTITDDQKRQIKVFKSLKNWAADNAHEIKGALTEKMIAHDEKIAQFITLDAYKKAGGKMLGDLFSEELYLEDAGLVNKLAKDTLQAAADKLKKEGYAWVESAFDIDWNFIWEHTQLEGKLTAEQKKKAGCYVTVERDGKIKVFRLIKKTAEKSSAGTTKKKEGGISNALHNSLASYRQEIAQVIIADEPNIALDLLTFRAASKIFGQHVYAGPDISFTQHPLIQDVAADKDTRAKKHLLTLKEKLNITWLKPTKESERFLAFRALPIGEKAALLAFAVASAMPPCLSGEKEDGYLETGLSQIGALAWQLWRPTRDNFLKRCTAAQLTAIVAEIYGKAAAKNFGKGNKKKMVDELHKAFADPAKASTDKAIQDKLLTWMPAGMEFGTIENPEKGKRAAWPT